MIKKIEVQQTNGSRLRTFVPIIVRGQEGDGVRFWGFGKQFTKKYLDICSTLTMVILLTHNGRDLTIQYISLKRPVLHTQPLRLELNQVRHLYQNSKDSVQKLLENQTEITDLYSELSYDELKDVLEGWLNPSKKKRRWRIFYQKRHFLRDY